MNMKINIFLVIASVVLFACKKDQVHATNPSPVVVSTSDLDESNPLTNGRKSSPVITEGINGSNTGDEDKD